MSPYEDILCPHCRNKTGIEIAIVRLNEFSESHPVINENLFCVNCGCRLKIREGEKDAKSADITLPVRPEGFTYIIKK